MRPYAGYLFDLDGTLVDTAPDIGAALNHALAEHGRPPVDETLVRHWVGHGARALIEQARARQAFPAADVEPILGTFLEHYTAHIADRSRPYPGVVEALVALCRRGAHLAVVTNKLTRLAVPLLEALSLAGYFDTVVCGDTAARPKPAADPARFACAALGIAPRNALFVGDSEPDVRCARAAGCPVVVVRDGYNQGQPADTLGADAVIESFLDLV